MTRVDLIIPTYNGGELLARCLRCVQASTFRDFAITVYDDGSSAPIADVVRAETPDARVLRSERNLGLAHGLNRALAATDAEFVALLNDDTEVEPDWLARLLGCAERHPDAGSVASKLRLMADRRKLHSAGDYYSVRGMPGNRGVWLDDLGQFDREEPIFGACGGAALYRRAALEAVALAGGQVFDERLFMYCEDVDLAWRLQRAGWSCWFAPDAVVYHRLSATAGGPLASYYVARNVWLLLARSVPRQVWMRSWPRVVACHAGRVTRMLRHVREPAARASLRGTLAGLATLAIEGCAAPTLTQAEIARLALLVTDPRAASAKNMPRC